MEKNYTIAGKIFTRTLTLGQDELLGPITYDMLENCDGLMEASDGLAKARKSKQLIEEGNVDSQEILNGEQLQKVLVSVAFGIAKGNSWLYKMGYAKKILAILLVPQDEELKKQSQEEREQFMADNATREIANEVINFFFKRSGAFGINTLPSSANEA